MWSFLKSIVNKIFGRTEAEEPTKTETTPSQIIEPKRPTEIIKPRVITKPKEQEKSQEKILETKTIKMAKEPKKRAIKTQEKLPVESSFDIKKANIEVIKEDKAQPIKSQTKESAPQTKNNLSWKEQANAAEKIKKAFQGFFYDVASLESINDPDLKKNNFENYKITFKTKLKQNLLKLDLLDQQILQHISDSLLSKSIKDINETLEKQTMEQVSKVPDKYIN